MAEITKRRTGELARAVFKILLDAPDGLPSAAVMRRMEKVCPPTPFEEQDYAKHPGTRRYESLIRFSTITSVKAGWLLKVDGRWSLTPLGKEAYAKYTTPESFRGEARLLYQAWKRGRPKPAEEEEPEEEEEVQTSIAVEQAEDAARTQIREHLERMPPFDFQNLVAALLKGMGYYVPYVASPGPDRGVDIIAFSDPLGVHPPRIKVQVKRQGSTINAEKLRAFLSTISDVDAGIFICTGGFTSDAQEEARHDKRRITLLNLDDLVRLWITHYDRIAAADRQMLPLRAVHFLALE